MSQTNKFDRVNNQKVYASELVANLYIRLRSKFIEFYHDNNETISKNKKSNNGLKKEEEWKDKNEKKFHHQKGFYYRSSPYFYYKDEDYNVEYKNKINSVDFEFVFNKNNKFKDLYIQLINNKNSDEIFRFFDTHKET